MNKKLSIAIAATVGILALAGCSDTDRTVVDANLTKDADNFKIDRRITAINGITDKYLFTVEGKCSIENEGKQLTILCLVGKDDDGNNLYKKSFVGLSDNVTYVAEQIAGVPQDPYHYKLVFKPEVILPDVEVRTSQGDVSTAP